MRGSEAGRNVVKHEFDRALEGTGAHVPDSDEEARFSMIVVKSASGTA